MYKDTVLFLQLYKKKKLQITSSIPVGIPVAVAGAIEAVAVVGEPGGSPAPTAAPAHAAHHRVLHRHPLDVCKTTDMTASRLKGRRSSSYLRLLVKLVNSIVVDPNTSNFGPDPEFWPNMDPDPELCNQF